MSWRSKFILGLATCIRHHLKIFNWILLVIPCRDEWIRFMQVERIIEQMRIWKWCVCRSYVFRWFYHISLEGWREYSLAPYLLINLQIKKFICFLLKVEIILSFTRSALLTFGFAITFVFAIKFEYRIAGAEWRYFRLISGITQQKPFWRWGISECSAINVVATARGALAAVSFALHLGVDVRLKMVFVRVVDFVQKLFVLDV